jgi:methionyl-tRNA synthetase
LQIAAALSSLCEPFIYSKEIIKNLKIKVHWAGDFRNFRFDYHWTPNWSGIAFAKIEDEEIQKQIDKLEATKRLIRRKQSRNQKRSHSVWWFLKWICALEQSASKMPKANKLLILKVDTGIDVRTIVSGIAESF